MTDITFVVATHNRPAMLEVGLHSILASAASVKGIKTRIIVVDDASETMAAREITKRLRVDYVRRNDNGGVAQTLFTGFEQVDSEFYALWGDDDYMLPRWFSLHLAKMAEGYDVVASSYWKTDVELKLTQQVTLPVATFADLRRGQVNCNDQSLVRRDSLGDIKFRPERERAMLMTFWLAMAAAGKKFGVIEEPTWLYRRHSGQLSERRPSPHDMELRQAATAEYAVNHSTAWIDAFG